MPTTVTCVDVRASWRRQGHPATKPSTSSPAKLQPAGTQMWSFASAMYTAQGTKPRDLPKLHDRPSKCFLALPHDALSSSTLRYYAFAVTEDFLADLARAAPKRERLRVPHADGVQLTHHGLRLVSARTGARRIFLTAGRIDRDRPPRHPPPFVAPNGIVPLVAVCSSEPSSYRKRPSQEQVDRLMDIFGTPPQWWTAFSRDMPRQPAEEVIASARA
ncbi:unnamed protein product [Peniophora sp. CBMAI 1063]|nr:unnamed protein product [Peniophora sp. CBMAI 1063]